MARRRSFCGAATVALAVLGLGAARDASAQAYLITEIAAPSGVHTVAKGLNSNGTVVGYSFTTAPNTDAFTSISGWRWSGGVLTYVTGTLPDNIVTGINNSDEVVGFDFFLSGAGFVNPVAFVDLPAPNHGLTAGVHPINFGGSADSAAYGINDAGLVVGEGVTGDGSTKAFLFIPPVFSGPIGSYNTAGVKDLGTLGGSNSAAHAINNLNQIAGGSVAAKGDYKAFLWLPSPAAPYAAGMNNLGGLSTLGDSSAFGLNEDGDVAGMSYTGTNNVTSRAVFFDHGVKTQFGPLSGGTSTGANGINVYDQLVGFSSITSSATGTSRALIMVNGKKYDLNSLIAGGSGWQLLEATAVNDKGVIVGYGTKPQNDLTVPTRGFVLTPNFSLQPNTNVPANMTGGTSVNDATVNIDQAVGMDVVVKLSSDNVAVHVPASAVILAGSSSGTFTITTDAGASGTATITASLFGVLQQSVINLTPTYTPHISTFTVTPASVLGGAPVTASVTIDTPSVGNTTIPLTKSGFPNGGLPASLPNIVVANGQTTGSVSITTQTVPDVSSGTIYATLNGVSSAPLTINPLQVKAVTLSPSSVIGGDSTTVKVTLNGKAPAGGQVVDMSYVGTGDPLGGSPPATVIVPAGTTFTTFSLQTNTVTTRKQATVTAQVGSTPAISASLTVNPIGVSALVITPNPVSVTAGTATATVTIERPAPAGGWTVRLTTTSAAKADFAAGASSVGTLDVVIPAGQTTSGPITIYLNAVGSPVIKATAPLPPTTGAKTKSVTLTITS